MLFSCVRTLNAVDYLYPQSIDKFFSLTYDQYYRRFAPFFGSTISMTYFDNVNLRFNQAWTPAFNEKFQQKHGFSPAEYYPALWYDPSRARMDMGLHRRRDHAGRSVADADHPG